VSQKNPQNKPLPPQILFEDQALFVINKPSGWIVNDAATAKSQPVLQSWLDQKPYPLSKSREHRSGIVHRLDKETSGVLIVAKTASAMTFLQQEFKARTVSKTYTALVHGQPQPGEGSVSLPIARLPWNRHRFGIVPGGRPALTYYQTQSVFRRDNQTFSLLSLEPKTGRTHQLRVHLQHLRCPIVSDPLYAGRKTARQDRAWCPRLFLHAAEITFRHPTSHRLRTFQSPLPTDLAQALSTLQPL